MFFVCIMLSFCVFSLGFVNLAVSTSAVGCLVKLSLKMTCYVSSGLLNCSPTHSFLLDVV